MIWSYTALSQAERCPRAFRAKYITKTMPSTPPSPAQQRGIDLHRRMEVFVKTGEMAPEYGWMRKFVPAKLPGQVHLAEHPVAIRENGRGCDFWDPKAWFRGKVDMLILEASAGIGVILDWKTGTKWEDDDELQVFAALLTSSMDNPPAAWCGQYVWLKDRVLGQEYDLEPEKTLVELRNRVAKINADDDSPKTSALCAYCGLKEKCFGK